jgi:hypothetical protein
MKKLLLWIIGLLLLVMIAVGVSGYLAYRAARPVLESARAYLSGFGPELAELDKKIANQTRFDAPASSELTREQVERFARVQQSVRGALGQRFGEIEAKYQHLKFTRDGPQTPSVADLLTAVSDLSGVLVDARRAQVDALNKEKFSSAEYDWVRMHFYQAAGVNSVNRGLGDLQKLVQQLGERPIAVTAEVPLVKTPPANRELVKPYQRFIDDWLPMLFFGL